MAPGRHLELFYRNLYLSLNVLSEPSRSMQIPNLVKISQTTDELLRFEYFEYTNLLGGSNNEIY